MFPAWRFRQRKRIAQGLVNGVFNETWNHSCLQFLKKRIQIYYGIQFRILLYFNQHAYIYIYIYIYIFSVCVRVCVYEFIYIYKYVYVFVCRTREPSRNFELRPLLNPRGSPVLTPLARIFPTLSRHSFLSPITPRRWEISGRTTSLLLAAAPRFV